MFWRIARWKTKYRDKSCHFVEIWRNNTNAWPLQGAKIVKKIYRDILTKVLRSAVLRVWYGSHSRCIAHVMIIFGKKNERKRNGFRSTVLCWFIYTMKRTRKEVQKCLLVEEKITSRTHNGKRKIIRDKVIEGRSIENEPLWKLSKNIKINAQTLYDATFFIPELLWLKMIRGQL